MHFRNVCARRTEFGIDVLKEKKPDVIDIRVFIFSGRTIRVDGICNQMGVFWRLFTVASMTLLPSLI